MAFNVSGSHGWTATSNYWDFVDSTSIWPFVHMSSGFIMCTMLRLPYPTSPPTKLGRFLTEFCTFAIAWGLGWIYEMVEELTMMMTYLTSWWPIAGKTTWSPGDSLLGDPFMNLLGAALCFVALSVGVFKPVATIGFGKWWITLLYFIFIIPALLMPANKIISVIHTLEGSAYPVSFEALALFAYAVAFLWCVFAFDKYVHRGTRDPWPLAHNLVAFSMMYFVGCATMFVNYSKRYYMAIVSVAAMATFAVLVLWPLMHVIDVSASTHRIPYWDVSKGRIEVKRTPYMSEWWSVYLDGTYRYYKLATS